jgi:hypothetical protein
VFGFPGRTTQYLHSKAVQQIQDVLDPAKIKIREKALQVIDGFMRRNEQIKIQYAAKYASIENAYKKWKGEVLGLRSKGAIDKKKAAEAAFEKIVLAKPEMNIAYVDLLQRLHKAHTDIEYYALARDYFNEIVGKLEILVFAAQLNAYVASLKGNNVTAGSGRAKLLDNLEPLYAEYSAEVDQKLMEVLLQLYVADQDPALVSPYLKDLLAQHNNDYAQVAAAVFAQSKLRSFNNVRNMVNDMSGEALAAAAGTDMACRLIADMQKTFAEKIAPKLNEHQANINRLQRTYMQAQMDVFSGKTFYPDANSTLRLTYGQVKKSRPRDGMQYEFVTYLDGVMEKYKPGDYEFDVPQKLIDLYNKKDFGPYGSNGRQTVCFIAANHTTGGNSGSPALDANGNLIGLNFDRAWEGTMSDINYDPSICRNIMVDIRYVLFIIDKFAGATNLIKEMKIVK